MLITHPCMYDCIERKRMPVKGKSGKNTSDMIPVMFSCLILFAVPCLLARINMAASETLPRNSAQGTSVPAEDALADQYNTPDSVFYHRDVLPEVHINQDYLTNQYDYGIACFLWDIYGQAASIFDQLYYTASQPVYINHPLFSEHSTYEYLNLDLLASSMTFHISGNYSRSYETLKLIDPEPLPADLKAIYALHRDFFSTLIERDAKNTTQNIKKPIQYYEEPEDLYEYYDDPFDVDYYSSPEEFYEDHKNDFRSFKDAEDYFYEYGYW